MLGNYHLKAHAKISAAFDAPNLVTRIIADLNRTSVITVDGQKPA